MGIRVRTVECEILGVGFWIQGDGLAAYPSSV